jgi:hypothetical protein
MSDQKKMDVLQAGPEVFRQQLAKAPKETMSALGNGELPPDPPFFENLTQEHGEPPLRELRGAPLAHYITREIRAEDTLLGNRYLCRGGGMFAVAPSGIGKSVWAVQAAILWAVGRPAFGIKPARALKILILQAEDDEGDCIEMAQMALLLKLSAEEMELLKANVWMEPLNDLTGDDFLLAVGGFMSQFRADIIIINPYTSYIGCEVKDDGANNHFLRNVLNPLLTKWGCAAIIIHHTPKTNFRDTTNWRPSDWMYSGSGASCLTNWARAYLVIDPTEVYGVYKLIAAKRGQRIGWGDAAPVFETYWSHSKEKGELLWLPSSETEISSAAKTGKNVAAEDLLDLVPVVDPISRDKFRSLAKGTIWKIGEKRADRFLRELVESDLVTEISKPRAGTNPEKTYVRK